MENKRKMVETAKIEQLACNNNTQPFHDATKSESWYLLADENDIWCGLLQNIIDKAQYKYGNQTWKTWLATETSGETQPDTKGSIFSIATVCLP